MSNNQSPLEKFLWGLVKNHNKWVETFGEIWKILWEWHEKWVKSVSELWNTINNIFWNMSHSRLLTELNGVFSGENKVEKQKNVELTSTRGEWEPQDYEYAVTHAQPDDKWLWYREVFSEKLLSEEKQKEFIVILREAIETKDEKLIRKVVKSMFRFLWTKMWTGLTHEEIEEVVNTLDSFKSPFIVPVEKIWDGNIYLMNETTWPTDAFKDLALQQIPTMLSIITRRKNTEAVKQALENEKNGITYKLEQVGGEEKLVKYINWEKASDEEQGNRPKISIVVTQTSTSGDTWPAGWAWIQGKDFVANIIWFPSHEATQWQIGQMKNLEWNVTSIAFEEAFTEIQEQMKACNNIDFKQKLQEILEKKFKTLREKYGFDIEVSSGSFNSVNIGRIDAQSIYHSAWIMIAKAMNPEIAWDIIEAIPSGNFWHATWVIQARDMVGWIDDIIISTNENDAIYQLIKNWNYKMALSEISDPSVSMIIRYGSNVERLLRRITNPERCEELMKKFELDGKLAENLYKFIHLPELKSQGWNISIKNNENINKILKNLIQSIEETQEEYKSRWWDNQKYILGKLLNNLKNIQKSQEVYGMMMSLENDFASYFNDTAWIKLGNEEREKITKLKLKAYTVKAEDELYTMRKVWLENNRLICPHTANAFFAAEQYKEENPENTKSIVVSETASPWKFLASVATALTCENRDEMRKKYEELRPKENSPQGIQELIQMIKEAYEKNGKEFDENMIPENLRNIYQNGVKKYGTFSAKQFGEKTLEFVDDIWDIFPKQTEKLIEKEKAKK